MEPGLLEKVIGELKAGLTGGVVSRVTQPDARTVVLKVFVPGGVGGKEGARGETRLLISVRPELPRMHLTAARPPCPPRPPRFCALLRSRITGALIDGFEQVPGERIARILLKKRVDGEVRTFTLVAELTGKSANVILLDGGGRVIDAIKRFPAGSVRTVEPGVRLGPLPPPPVAPPAGGKGGDLGLPPKEPGETWNEAADRFFTAIACRAATELERKRLARVVKRALKRAVRLKRNLEGDRARAEEGLGGYRYGELLVTNLHAFARGAAEVVLTDYTVVPPEEVTVPLDRRLTPRENAERFFKLARKSKRALELIAKRMPAVEGEIEYLKTLEYAAETAETEGDVEALAAELAEGGYLKVAQERKEKKEAPGAEPVRRYRSSEGFEIICGRSGRGNDLIVRELASGEDIWMHADRAPGSHVLVKVAGRAGELTRKTIEEAAALAAWHSKARGAMKVDVIYTPARNVRKPRGAKPGLVTVREHKTIRVKPADME